MSIFGSGSGGYPPQRRTFSGRWIIAGVIALVSVIAYLGRTAINPVTGQKQHISLTVDQEIALGLQSAPEMAREFGGLDPDPNRQAVVQGIGKRIVSAIPKAGDVYPFEFHLLADPKTVNAFALPGGQIFITAALFDRLKSEGQLAGVLGHEIGHVVERHSAERLSQSQLLSGLVGAVGVGAYDPNHPTSQNVAIAAAAASQMISLKYGRNDELEADHDGVKFMAMAGFDPRSMVKVMEILKEASGGGHQPEFFSTHPDPGNRIEHIEAEIKEQYPNGVPDGLKP
jgi:beta-barrel assembly-enhancing protease